MSEDCIDLEMLKDIITCRDDLLFWLTDENAPPKKYADRLWEAYKQIDLAVDAMKLTSGYDEFKEGEWTIYAPVAEAPRCKSDEKDGD